MFSKLVTTLKIGVPEKIMDMPLVSSPWNNLLLAHNIFQIFLSFIHWTYTTIDMLKLQWSLNCYSYSQVSIGSPVGPFDLSSPCSYQSTCTFFLISKSVVFPSYFFLKIAKPYLLIIIKVILCIKVFSLSYQESGPNYDISLLCDTTCLTWI